METTEAFGNVVIATDNIILCLLFKNETKHNVFKWLMFVINTSMLRAGRRISLLIVAITNDVRRQATID